MILLLQSALRALLLGASVWALLRLLRLRDARSETAAWTLVLAASLAMPLLTPLLARWLPGDRLLLPAAPAPAGALAALPPAETWLAAHASLLLWSGYLLGAAVMLARLGIGLLLSQRLYRRTVPLADFPFLRIGASVRSPMVFGRCILLPADWREWPEAKRAAVLAHEQCHLARGDFFLQLAATLYRAFFWFSPFAWWLQRELSALAERASDAAAVQRMGDPASYAEILVEAAARAQGMPALVAMAGGRDIAWRVDRILTGGDTESAPGSARRLLAAAGILGVSITIAGVHAAIPAQAATPQRLAQARTNPAAIAAPGIVRRANAAAAPIAHPSPRPAAHARAAAPPAPAPVILPVQQPEPEFTYNPRALLDGPTVAVLPAALIVTQQ